MIQRDSLFFLAARLRPIDYLSTYCKVVLYNIIFFAVISSAYSQSSLPPNFRIFPGPVTQTEPVIFIHPQNPLIMFASARTINTNNGFTSEGVYTSTDGGNTWHGSDTCKGAFIGNHGGDPGVVISPSGRFILSHIGEAFTGVYSHFSTDMGTTWSFASTITSDQPEDKGTIDMDTDPSSPYYGKIYLSWVSLNGQLPPVLFSTSSNSGDSWSAPVIINNSPTARCSGGFIKTGKAGMVFSCWAGMTQNSPFYEDFVGFAFSTNGGTNWSVNQNIFDVNGIAGTLSSKNNIRVNGLPQIEIDKSGGSRDGWLYIVTTERNHSPAGSDPDIILHSSQDSGKTWSAGIRVNQDLINNGKTQYFPSIHVDDYGAINIIYYDDRNTASDSAEVMLSRSLDGGITWHEKIISDHRFKPKPIPLTSNYQGDHVALTSSGNKLFAYWMDDITGIYQIWSTILDISSLSVPDEPLQKPFSFHLEQNYPNPFNPNTELRFEIRDLSFVTLTIYDLVGKEVQTLVNKELHPGKYSVHWNAGSLSSGIYFYRLSAGNFSETRKLILQR